MHSTLEEAWPTHQSRHDRKSKECDLFDSRSAKVKRPYKSKPKVKRKQNKMRNMMLFDEEDYENGMLKSELEKYHGYADSREFSRTKNRSTPRRKKKIVVEPEQNTYEEDQSSDSEEEIIEEEEVRENPPEYIFEEVYEEDDDNYLSAKMNMNKTNLNIEKANPSPVVVEEELEGDYLPLTSRAKPISNANVNDMNQLLDLSIYTLSGILLIVILEQFVQLGVKLKGV